MAATHGTASTYRSPRYKCRCEPCTVAHRERFRWEQASRRERLAADPSLAPHGRYLTYQNWGCRCEPCTSAHSERCRQNKARRAIRHALETQAQITERWKSIARDAQDQLAAERARTQETQP